jgi:hypothetical protein
MSEVLKNIELIENYVEGKLSENERRDFETRLIIDGDFKEEYDLYKSVVAGIKAAGFDDLKAKLKLADDELDSNNIVKLKTVKRSNTRVYLSIAASIVLILGIAFIWKINTINDLSRMADSMYEKEKGLPVEMSINTKGLNDAMNSYKTGDYQSAKNYLTDILNYNPANDTTNFYLGVINYELNDFKGAESFLSSVEPTSKLYSKAEYRLLLTYMKLNSKEHAEQTCTQILSNPNHPYLDKAKLISKKLLSKKKESS